MSEVGLRERKKRRARQHIADTAARLFGERGYERVAMADVAAAADVSVQTLYNYFHGKRDLLLDREGEITGSLVQAVTERATRTSPVAAIRPVVLAEVALLRSRTRAQARGELPTLCAASAEVRRFTLEAQDRQASRLAEALLESGAVQEPFAAKALAAAVLSVLQSLLDYAGERLLAGATPKRVADEAELLVGAALDELERAWTVRRPARRR